MVSIKCRPGCTCKKHTSWKIGVEAAREGTRKAAAAGVFKERSRKTSKAWEAKSEAEKEAWRQKCSEAKKQEWAKAKAEGRRRNIHFGTKKRSSKHELVLVPYMKALGYEHNQNTHIGRRIPDFIDEEGKRIYEYMGTYWHPPEHEHKAIQDYATHGYTCTVLWESSLYYFLDGHKELVTPEEHDLAWKAAKVNNGFKKPSHLNR